MNSTLQHNLSVIQKRVLESYPIFESRLIMPIFTQTADAVFEWIDGLSVLYLNDTFNLRDSIGFGVFKHGVLLNWIQTPSPKATSNKFFNPVSGKYENEMSFYSITLSGRELLNKAIADGEYSTIADYAIVLYVAMPYGVDVEYGGGKRGTGWWSEGLVPYVQESFLTAIAKYGRR